MLGDQASTPATLVVPKSAPLWTGELSPPDFSTGFVVVSWNGTDLLEMQQQIELTKPSLRQLTVWHSWYITDTSPDDSPSRHA